MKATVTISFEVDDLESVERIIKSGTGSATEVESVAVDTPAGTVRLTSIPAPEAPAEAPVSDAGAEDAAVAKRKAAAAKARETRAKNKAKRDAANTEVVAEVDDETPAETPAKKPDAKVTDLDLKKAVKTAIESKGIDAVRSVFASFKSKSGEPCAKLSDVKESDFSKVVEALA